MPTNKKPIKLTIRSYQVGFGDCFLLLFEYPPVNGQPDMRCVLIDCGSTERPANAPSLKKVASQITKDCGGKLAAIIATHRHADHINGFETNKKADGPGDILRQLNPNLVIQPWTENPDLARDATSPLGIAAGNGQALVEKKFIAGLEGMHDFAELIRMEARRLGTRLPKATRAQLSFLGEENIKNASAVRNLIAMGEAGKAEYLHYGKKTALSKELPGVKIHVLGPPTPKQYPAIKKQRDEDEAEFWHLLGASARRLTAKGGIAPFAQKYSAGTGRNGKKHPPHTRWMINRIIAAHIEQRLQIVRTLDAAMNNTSLILLFEVGGKKFLFPGDAQIENWSYALKDAPQAAANRTLLQEADFYKVGHHGSLNATPKSLWALFKKKGNPAKANRLRTAVSTMADKHGTPSSNTEVPRRTLVAALKADSTYFSTQLLKVKTSKDIIFDL